MTIPEELRWRKIPVGTDGFVCLVDWMGDDKAITQAARVCYGDGTKSVSDDRTLIRYLMRHQHTTPFEMAEIKLLVRVPMDCWRQWIRHRTASTNEYSTRYSVAIDSAQTTNADCWREQSTENRQGSGGYISSDVGHVLSQQEHDLHEKARDVYDYRIKAGVAREQARKDLPLSTYTEAYWKVDLHNLFNFLRLRMAPDAQQEIRDYAQVIGNIVGSLFPLAYEAFQDYVSNAMRLSRQDQNVICYLAKHDMIPVQGEIPSEALPTLWRSERCRERAECLEKLRRLRLALPNSL